MVHEGCGELVRVSVYSDAVHLDLALPAAVPVGSLIPQIVDILTAKCGHNGDSVAAHRQLSLPGHLALDPSKTLAQIGIRDGTVLILTDPSAALAAPYFDNTAEIDDVAEAISMSLAVTARPWTRRATRLIGATVASWLVGTGAAVLIRAALYTSDVQRTDNACAAAVVGAAALLTAAVGHRVFRDRLCGLTLGMAASGFAAIAGLLAVPDGPGAPNALLAAMAAAAMSTVAMHVIGCCAVAFTALSCFAAVAAAAAAAGTVTTAPLQAIGAMSAVISLGLLEASARVSIVLAGLSPRLASEPRAGTEEPKPAPHRLSTNVICADNWLTSLVVAFSASAGLGAIGAAVGACSGGSPRLVGITFAAVTGGVLLLRARSHRDLARSVPLVASGTAALSTTFVVAATIYPMYTPGIATAAAMLAIAALGLGLTTPTTAISPVGRRSIELLEYLSLTAIVPLACWICGLYSAARGLSLS